MTVNDVAYRIVAYPLVAVGFLLTMIAGGMIKTGAWLMGYKVEEQT